MVWTKSIEATIRKLVILNQYFRKPKHETSAVSFTKVLDMVQFTLQLSIFFVLLLADSTSCASASRYSPRTLLIDSLSGKLVRNVENSSETGCVLRGRSLKATVFHFQGPMDRGTCLIYNPTWIFHLTERQAAVTEVGKFIVSQTAALPDKKGEKSVLLFDSHSHL